MKTLLILGILAAAVLVALSVLRRGGGGDDRGGRMPRVPRRPRGGAALPRRRPAPRAPAETGRER